MRSCRNAAALALVVLAALMFVGCPKPDSSEPTPTPTATPVAASACTFPTTPAGTLEETAWQLFVAATCPSTGTNPLTFENWTEQNCLKPGSCTGEAAAKRQLHASHLAENQGGLPSGDCSGMTTATASGVPPSLIPFVPTNLAANPTFCEEVFVDDTEAAYIQQPAAGHSLLTITQQAAYVKSGATIAFPTAAVEIKADWLPASSLSPAGFDCANPSPDIYTEVINGNCYALVGMHISSKLEPNWLWATFEPQLTATNPNRCKPNLYNSCSDPFGSNPAASTGASTQITPALAAMMDQAQLPPAFKNYRLTGVQSNYVDANTTPLGNSFVEFNAQVPAGQASCITCHSYAQINTATTPAQRNNNFGPGQGQNATGTPTAMQGGDWHSQDFSWLLGILPE
jgi:hypothetical protein